MDSLPRRTAGLAGLMLLLAACGQTAEAPTGTGASGSVPAPGATSAPVDTSAATAPDEDLTTPPTEPSAPEGTDVNDETEPTLELRPATTKPTPVSTPRPVSGDIQLGAVDPALQSLAASAASDLAKRLGVDVSAIEVVTAEVVVWPDSSLGCPQPGMYYLQVLTDGFRVLLEHGGTIFSYHGGGGTYEPFLCEQPDTRIVGTPPPEIDM